MVTKRSFPIYRLTYLAILSAIVVVLQLAGSFVRLGTFSICPVLIPIVLGAIIGGPAGGAWLGLVFGVTVLMSGDAAFFLGINPVGTIITVLAKGILCGLCAGLVYRIFAKRTNVAALMAAIVSPLVNTGVFMLGSRIFFWQTMQAGGQAEGLSAFGYLILFMVGGNFIFEFIFNIVLCPALNRLIRLLPQKAE